MEDGDIIKVNNSPYTDAKFLRDDYDIRVAGTLDLRFVAEKADCQPGKISEMSGYYLGDSIEKNWSCSEWAATMNWEASSLTDELIEYAAKDVHLAIELFKYFAEKIAPGKSSRYIMNILRQSGYVDRTYGPQPQPRHNWVRLQ